MTRCGIARRPRGNRRRPASRACGSSRFHPGARGHRRGCQGDVDAESRTAARAGARPGPSAAPRCSSPASANARLTSISAACRAPPSGCGRLADNTIWPAGWPGSAAANTSAPATRGGRAFGQHHAALERAAVLAARDDLLARIAALLEVHAAHQLEVDHLRHEGLDGAGDDARHARLHLEPVPHVGAGRRRPRRRRVGRRGPQQARRSGGVGEADGGAAGDGGRRVRRRWNRVLGAVVQQAGQRDAPQRDLGRRRR